MASKAKETEEVIEEVSEEEIKVAEKKETKKEEEKEEERVDVFVPRGADVLISVNFKSFLLPAGKTSRVPKYIAEEFYRSQRAMTAYEEKSAEMQERAKQQL